MTLTKENLTHTLKVKRRIQETSESISLVFEIPDPLKATFHFKAGQFVTLFLDVDGKEIRRSYSLSSSPLVDQDFKITIKRVPGGLGSNYVFDHVFEGSSVAVTPPAGHFFKPSDVVGQNYFLFAGGSGITPIFSILKTVLASDPQARVALLYANRNEEGIVYRSELTEWEKKHTDRLKVLHLLSRPSGGWSGAQGRINIDLVSQVLKIWDNNKHPLHDKNIFYLCGPIGFMEVVKSSLQSLGVQPGQIRTEDFGMGAVVDPLPEGAVMIGDEAALRSSTSLVHVLLNGESFEVSPKSGQTILEALIEIGANPPYSCMDGACMACLAKVPEGLVVQSQPGILTEDNIAAREVLTCQARPLSGVVRIDYDNL